ncbi:glycoside hydrolase family 31 protein [Flavivirga eckloniae]|uniref:Uncharacterized protein n=1 Tax=Flavivirga eckloniae TaxID=1803846 RepID=A0A2K9PW42_9FLAO|nr:TIM-barrel domain-containing protein [Flavivirga eckloniae]AUP81260.1 hypothetical protein C1H87_22090 [Flavivirga eckloniae]
MKIYKLFNYAIAIALSQIFFACNGSDISYEKTDHSVVILGDSISTEITVINDNILHIRKYGSNSKSSDLPDYVTILEPQSVSWKVSEQKDRITIKTSKVEATINIDGVISYQSSDGESLLHEKPEETYINKEGVGTHTVSQAFHARNEGLYGLGQYQNGIMNWKNEPVRLMQYNQEIAIPFLVSTKKYGIYWHNYSVTDFNYPKNEISFVETADEDNNVSKTTFTPEKTGEYSFIIDSEWPDNANRRGERVLMTIDSDTVVQYSTVWMPSTFSGKMNLKAGKKYEVVFHNIGSEVPGKILYNEPDFNKTVFSSRYGNAIDYYFIHAENPTDILSQYSNLTGKAPMFPKSAFGFWQCRERYHNQEELLTNAREYRKRNIPIDNIVQDWFYWPEGAKGPEWDRQKYPNPKKMIEELDALNLNLMVSVWPEVKNQPLLNKYNLEKSIMGNTSFIDIYDKNVQERYYRMLSDSMFHIGVQSIWLDGTEPEAKPKDDYQTAVGKFGEVTNPYSLMVTKTMYEGRRNEYPNERVFNLTRSAYAGQQRYGAASWSGDVAATWEQFAEQIPAGLNFMMAGVPYWTTDIGGFFRDAQSLNPIYKDQYTNQEFIELLTRWFQFGTFNPIFRIHGYVSETEIWRYGQEFEDTARKYIDMRYQFLPYIYSEAWKVTQKGNLLMSPLVYTYPDDENTWKIKDQFFLGESMMVCPVTKYKARERDVYLPKGNWYHFETNEKISGGKTIVANAPLNSVPVYIKEGTILPIGPKVQYATQETDKPITLKIYPGVDASYTLYLDDNGSYDYEKGTYSEINISYSESGKVLTLAQGKDGFVGFNNNPMMFTISVVGTDTQIPVTFNGEDISKAL